MRRPDALDPRVIRFLALRGWHGFQRHRDIDSVASLTYFATLTLFPAGLTAVSILSLFTSHERAIDRVVQLIHPLLRSATEQDIREPLRQLVQIQSPWIGLGVGIAFLLYAASSYATAFGRAINNVYEVQEGRRLWTTRSKNVVVALVVVVSAGLSVVLLFATPELTLVATRQLGIGPGWATLVSIVKWPVVVALGLLIIATLFYATPNVRIERRVMISYGTAFTLIAAALGSVGFLLYVSRFADYSRAYGWLGGGLLIMWWLFVVNLAFMIGAEFDAEAVRYAQLRNGMPAETVVHVQMRSTKRNLSLARGLAEDVARARAIRRGGEAEVTNRSKHHL